MAAIFGEGKIFWKLQRLHSLDTLWVENFDEIALSRTVKEIEANLCFAIFGKNSKIKFKLKRVFLCWGCGCGFLIISVFYENTEERRIISVKKLYHRKAKWTRVFLMTISVGLNMWNYDYPGLKIQDFENVSVV